MRRCAASLRGVQLDPLSGGRKAAGDPVRQHALRLLGEFEFMRKSAQRLDELETPVGLKLRALHENDGAGLRDVGEHLDAVLGRGEAVEIGVADFNEAALGEKGRRVHRLSQSLRVKVGPVQTLVAEAVLPFRETELFELEQILLAQVVLRPPQEVQRLRSTRFEGAKLGLIIQFFLFPFLSHSALPVGSRSSRPGRF